MTGLTLPNYYLLEQMVQKDDVLLEHIADLIGNPSSNYVPSHLFSQAFWRG